MFKQWTKSHDVMEADDDDYKRNIDAKSNDDEFEKMMREKS